MKAVAKKLGATRKRTDFLDANYLMLVNWWVCFPLFPKESLMSSVCFLLKQMLETGTVIIALALVTEPQKEASKMSEANPKAQQSIFS